MTITVKEALEKGYVLCGYENLENQRLIDINDVSEEDFKIKHHGKICVANKQSNSVTISSEEIIEWLVDKYFDTDENPDDDSNDIELCFKEKIEIIEEFVSKMNNIYSTKKWYFLSDLQLVP